MSIRQVEEKASFKFKIINNFVSFIFFTAQKYWRNKVELQQLWILTVLIPLGFGKSKTS